MSSCGFKQSVANLINIQDSLNNKISKHKHALKLIIKMVYLKSYQK